MLMLMIFSREKEIDPHLAEQDNAIVRGVNNEKRVGRGGLGTQLGGTWAQKARQNGGILSQESSEPRQG